jgi:hypothetical protein
MDRRERLLGIAEKLPKSGVTAKPLPAKTVVGVAKRAAAMAVRRPVIALESRRAPKRR